MGRACKFHRPLTRKASPSWPRSATGGGRHKEIQPPNVPWEIFLACSNGDGVDVRTFQALHTSIDLDGLYDLFVDAFEGFDGAMLFGGTRMVMKMTLSTPRTSSRATRVRNAIHVCGSVNQSI